MLYRRPFYFEKGVIRWIALIQHLSKCVRIAVGKWFSRKQEGGENSVRSGAGGNGGQHIQKISCGRKAPIIIWPALTVAARSFPMATKTENTAVIPAIFMTGSGGQKKTEKHRESEPAGTASRNRPHLPAFFCAKKKPPNKNSTALLVIHKLNNIIGGTV